MCLLLFLSYSLDVYLFPEDNRNDDQNVDKVNKIIKIYFRFLYFILI